MSAAQQNEQDFPLAKATNDGWAKDGKATATCFCGGVQMVFPTEKPGLVDAFVCHCTDCHVFSATMFASNFITTDETTSFSRGEELLKEYAQSKTIETGHTMTNHFCSTCGTLLFRTSSGFPGKRIMRIGTVDDFSLHSTVLRPRVEQYTKSKAAWLGPIDAKVHTEGGFYK